MIFIILILLVTNFWIFVNLKRLEVIFNIYDVPDNKLKVHSKKTPILGGLILIINYSIYLIYQLMFSDHFLSVDKGFHDIKSYLSLLILIFGFFILGFYDDKKKLSPKNKLFLSIIITLISLLLNKDLVINFFSFSFFPNKIFLGNYSIFFSIFCVILLINALNFYDGINGQSCIFFLIVFLFLFLKSEMNFFYLLSIVLIFFVLLLNLSNKLFLGDGGIFLLSAILSASLIYEHNIEKNIIYVDEIFFLLFLPGIDLIRLTISRSFNKKNPFLGDRKHIHHLLIGKYSLLNTNLILLILSIIPILLFLFFQLNFYLVLCAFLTIYFFLILNLKFYD